ncbi:MAG: ABC transporter permease [Bacillota bacterium]|nr:ABC transporter permease [Bacillota bacterium]
MRFYYIALKEIKSFIKNPYIIPPLLIVHFLQFVISINVFNNFVGESTITKNTFATIEIINKNNNTNIVIFYGAFILTQLLALSSIIVAAYITSEWENKTYDRILVSPLSIFQINIGIFSGYITLMIIISALFMFLISVLYGFDWGGAYFNIFIITVSLSFVCVTFAMLISNIFKQTKIVASIATFTVVAFIFLSGGLFAGAVFNKISRYTLIRWAFDAYISVIEGKPLGSVSINLINILLTGIIFMAIYIMITRKGDR